MTYAPTDAEVGSAFEAFILQALKTAYHLTDHADGTVSFHGAIRPIEALRAALIAAHNVRHPPGEDTMIAHGIAYDVTVDADGDMRVHQTSEES